MHARQQNERERLSLLFDQRDHIAGIEISPAGTWLDLDQMLPCIEPVKLELRNDGVAIRRKCRFLDQHAAARAAGPEETHHHQVQVDGERVHGDHFGFHGAGELGQRRGGMLVVADPRPPGDMVPEHAEAPPIPKFLFDKVRGRFGLKAQRVAA